MSLELTKLLSNTNKSLGTILHVGAGTGANLQELQRAKPRAITLVESSRALFTQLSKKIKKHQHIIAFNDWIVSSEDQTEKAHIFDNPRYNSLAAPLDIDVKLPNITLKDISEIEGRSINELIQSIKLYEKDVNILILSVLGYERQLIDSINEELIEKFEYIVIECSSKISYKGQWNSEAEIESFVRINTSCKENSDTLVYYFQINHSYINAKRELGLITQELRSSNNKILELEDAITELEATKKSLISEFEEYKTTSTADVAALNSTLQDTLKQLDELKTEKNEFQVKLKPLITEVEHFKGQHQNSSKWAKNLEAERDELLKIQELNESELSTLKKDLNTIETSHQDAKVRLNKQERALELTVKSNLRLEEENRELREAIKEKVSQETNLTKLVGQLFGALKETTKALEISNSKSNSSSGDSNE
ncbi:hypothetical protein [Alteromonas sp. OM2203]|uniref:hypothetical protein n=1 Tax=Alteromonas sp. OM2203 TaxID=3398817 RepID=UPI003AF3781F